jgi:hypothetical protein
MAHKHNQDDWHGQAYKPNIDLDNTVVLHISLLVVHTVAECGIRKGYVQNGLAHLVMYTGIMVHEKSAVLKMLLSERMIAFANPAPQALHILVKRASYFIPKVILTVDR